MGTKYTRAICLCLLLFGGHKLQPGKQQASMALTIPYVIQMPRHTFETYLIKKTRKEKLRDEQVNEGIGAIISNSLRFVSPQIGRWLKITSL